MIKNNYPPLVSRRCDYNPEAEFQAARARLAAITDIERQCRKSGARYLPAEKSVIIDYMNRFYRIMVPGGEVTYISSGEPAPLHDSILILHYFTRASGAPLTGRSVTYRELTGTAADEAAFQAGAVKPIAEAFQAKPEELREAAAVLGGRRTALKNTAVSIDALPYVPLTVAVRGGADPAPGCEILFDAAATDYLPAEDIVTLCEILARKLTGHVKTGGNDPGKR